MSGKTALLFPGQGAQAVGMGADLWATEQAQQMRRAADEALGHPLSTLMMKGPQAELTQTDNAQPALLLVAVAAANWLQQRGLAPDMLAGHSLGQYTALVVSGAIGLDAALRLVRFRGRLMQRAVPGGGAMMMMVDIDRDAVYSAVQAYQGNGCVEVACHNSPGQTVISGSADAVEAVADACDELGAGILPLSVAAPFHSRLLATIGQDFAEELAEIPLVAPHIPVIDNVTAKPLTTPDNIRESLVRHITEPVLFEETLAFMGNAGVTTFVHCGPGKSTLKQAHATVPQARAINYSNWSAELS